MRKVATTATLLITVLAIAAGVLATATPASAATSTTAVTENADFLDRVNDLRISRGLRPLIIDPKLHATALDWSSNLARTATLAHDAGLATDVSGWTKLAENVGTGSTVNAVWNAFLASPGHFANLIDPDMTHLGVGTVRDSAGRLWTTHRFMKAPARYADATPSHLFYEEIVWMTNTGLSEGFGDGTFRPAANVTRQAMSAWLHRLNGAPAGPFAAVHFTDVSTSPFKNEIFWMVSTGRAGGFPDGSFKPESCVTRQAMMAFLHREAGSPAGPFAATRFTDVPSTAPFATEIAWAVSEGIADGFADGNFRPGTCVSRQAAAAFLHRTFA